MRVTFVGTGDAFGSGGRRHTSMHLSGEQADVLLDLGATAYLGLETLRVDRNRIGTILITHFHGDHYGGLPYFVLDAQFRSHRTTPLTIAGPPGMAERFRALMDAAYFGYADAERAFRLGIREIAPGETTDVEGMRVTAFAVPHDPKSGTCLGYRIEAGDKVFAYSGDTGWTDTLLPLGRDADLFVCECYSRSIELPLHLNYRTLVSRLPEIGARRVVLTHMGEDMLDHAVEVQHEMAHDGLSIEF